MQLMLVHDLFHALEDSLSARHSGIYHTYTRQLLKRNLDDLKIHFLEHSLFVHKGGNQPVGRRANDTQTLLLETPKKIQKSNSLYPKETP